MKENRISIELKAADIEAVRAAISTIATTLQPYLIALEAEDKKSLKAIGDKSRPFVEKALQYAESNGEFLPKYTDLAEAQKDFKAFTLLKDLLKPLAQIAANIDDTATLCGDEAHSAANSYYRSVKDAAENGVTDAKPIYDDLKIRFEAQRARRKPVEPIV